MSVCCEEAFDLGDPDHGSVTIRAAAELLDIPTGQLLRQIVFQRIPDILEQPPRDDRPRKQPKIPRRY